MPQKESDPKATGKTVEEIIRAKENEITDVTQAHIAPCVSGIVGKHSGVLFGRVAPSSQNGSDGCASAPAPS